MPAWLIPALKVIPHIGSIISAAAPAFTQKPPESASIPPLLQQQIAELQTAASNNATNIKELAAQLQTTVQALEQGALQAEARLSRALRVCLVCAVAAAALSLAAILVVLQRT